MPPTLWTESRKNYGEPERWILLRPVNWALKKSWHWNRQMNHTAWLTLRVVVRFVFAGILFWSAPRNFTLAAGVAVNFWWKPIHIECARRLWKIYTITLCFVDNKFDGICTKFIWFGDAIWFEWQKTVTHITINYTEKAKRFARYDVDDVWTLQIIRALLFRA